MSTIIKKTKAVYQLSWGTKIGFGLGTAGDSIPYYLFFTYFLFYLTDVAGVSAAVAGVISFIAVAWDAITDPVVGYLSDNSKNPKGRRRPFMQKAILLEAAAILLIFAPFEMSGVGEAIYYIAIAVFFWTAYTMFAVPWQALASEMTTDYNERNTIGMCVAILAYPFMMLCNSGPMYLQSFLLPKGFTEVQCWFICAVILSVVLLIFASISIRATKGKERAANVVKEDEDDTGEGAKKKFDFFTSYKKLMAMSVYRVIVILGFLFLFGYMMCETSTVYVLTYNAGMTEVQQGMFWTMFTVIGIVGSPLTVVFANLTNKRFAFAFFSILLIIVCVFFYITKINSVADGFIYGGFVALCSTAFWGLFYPMIYDCNEVYEFRYGERREGAVIAFAQFIQKFGGAFATLIAGLTLEFFGYTGQAEPGADVLQGILTVATLLPAIIITISVLLLKKYAVTRESFEALKNAIELRKEGKEYSTEGFEKLIK